MTPNILGYHSNSRGRLKKFFTSNELVIGRDIYYLGEGMYFWDNISNAEWWAGEKIRKKEAKAVQIATCNIILTEPILDMTDRGTILKVRNLWNGFCKKMGIKSENHSLAKILDTLFKLLPEEFEDIKVTKGIGDYSNLDPYFWFIERRSKLDSRPKVIYTVKCNSKVFDPKFIKEVK